MISLLLKSLLYLSPTFEFCDKEVECYEEILQGFREDQSIPYNVEYSKSRFLQYIALTGDYLFHGSNEQNIDVFEPREQTLFNGELTTAVFATTDPIWPIFYAVLNRRSVIGNFRNGCLVYKNRRYHFYSLTESTMKTNPWIDGMIYILPKNKFYRPCKGRVHPDEWVCHEHVNPISKFKVNVTDFYFRDKVATHNDHEPLLKTWFFFKRRTMRA